MSFAKTVHLGFSSVWVLGQEDKIFFLEKMDCYVAFAGIGSFFFLLMKVLE